MRDLSVMKFPSNEMKIGNLPPTLAAMIESHKDVFESDLLASRSTDKISKYSQGVSEPLFQRRLLQN